MKTLVRLVRPPKVKFWNRMMIDFELTLESNKHLSCKARVEVLLQSVIARKMKDFVNGEVSDWRLVDLGVTIPYSDSISSNPSW